MLPREVICEQTAKNLSFVTNRFLTRGKALSIVMLKRLGTRLLRGENRSNGALFSYIDAEAHIRTHHLLRAVRHVVNEALADIDPVSRGLMSVSGGPLSRPNARCAR